jgi:tetratricopeptide (TPR) repeat protein
VAGRSHGWRHALLVLAAPLVLSGCAAKKLVKQGEALLEDGRTTHASRCYRQACEKRPSNGEFQRGYAIALLADGHADQAVAPARKALIAEVEAADLVLIEALVRTGQVDEARQLLDSALSVHPDSPDYLELSAREYLVRGQPRQAVVAMKKVVDIEPNGERIAYLAWLFARAHEMPRALEAAEQALATETHAVEALGDVAAVFLLGDRDDDRKTAAREIQSFGADVLELWKERAGRSQQVGDHEGALRAMTAAVAMRPDDGELQGLLGQMFLALGEHGRAISFLESALQTDAYRVSWERAANFEEENAVHTMGFENEQAATFCNVLAKAHQLAGHTEQAARSLRAALLIGGDDAPERWLEVAVLFAEAGNLRSAAHAAHHAQHNDPNHPGALVFLMKLYAGVGDAHQAVGYGRMAWSVLPGDPVVALTLGGLYERRGEPRAARELYLAALQQHPDVGALRAALQRVEN